MTEPLIEKLIDLLHRFSEHQIVGKLIIKFCATLFSGEF